MPENKPYRCAACGAEFGTRNELDQHNKVKHPGQKKPDTDL